MGSKRVSSFTKALGTLSLLVSSAVAQSQVTVGVTFDEYPLATATSTTIIDSEYQTGGADNTSSSLPVGGGFSLTATGNSNVSGDLTLYNSTPGTNGNDSDLEFSNTGNILIAQELVSGSTPNRNPDGSFIPDDVPNSIITVAFESPLSAFGFSIIDTEPGSAFTFTDSDGDSVTINATEFTNPSSPFFQGAACELGNNNFCIGTVPVSAAALTALPGPVINNIVEFELDFDASGGIDQFELTYQTGQWSGNVSEDTNNDGVGDTAIPNVLITLFRDIDGNGILTPDEIALQPDAPTTFTNNSGDYLFGNVLVGTYVAVETQPTGFDNVSELEGGADADVLTNPANNNQIAGFVASGETDSGNNFVESQA